MFYVYILQCADGTFYTGWTTDLNRRLQAHNAGLGSRYTYTHGPVTLVYYEEATDRSAAQRRERAIKRLSRQQKQALIAANSPDRAQ